MGATVLVVLADLPPLAWSVGILVLTVASLVWFVRGQAWVVAAAPPRDAAVVVTARRFGRRVLLLAVVVRVAFEAIWWVAAGDPSENGLFTSPVKTVLSTVVVAYVAGRTAEFNWLRRPPDAPTPRLLRILTR
jgi:hypothetical protein